MSNSEANCEDYSLCTFYSLSKLGFRYSFSLPKDIVRTGYYKSGPPSASFFFFPVKLDWNRCKWFAFYLDLVWYQGYKVEHRLCGMQHLKHLLPTQRVFASAQSSRQCKTNALHFPPVLFTKPHSLILLCLLTQNAIPCIPLHNPQLL